MLHNHSDFSASIAQQIRDARRNREIDAIETLISALEAYKTQLRFKQTSDFEELKVTDAIIDLFDDGDVVGRRDAILEENQWDEDGNPYREDGGADEEGHWSRIPTVYGAAK